VEAFVRAIDYPISWRLWTAVIIPIIGICIVGSQLLQSGYEQYRFSTTMASVARTLEEIGRAHV
jgi:hypothetical protein